MRRDSTESPGGRADLHVQRDTGSRIQRLTSRNFKCVQVLCSFIPDGLPDYSNADDCIGMDGQEFALR